MRTSPCPGLSVAAGRVGIPDLVLAHGGDPVNAPACRPSTFAGAGRVPGRHARRRLTGTAQRAPTVGSEDLPTLDDMSILERGAADPLVAAAGPLGRRARLDEVVRLTAASVLWLSLLLVTYWWVADGGVRDLRGWAGGLTSTGRLTGLVASVLLLAQVVLMARVPRLEAAFGQDRLAHGHRLVGFTSFNLMLAHIVLITWGTPPVSRPDPRDAVGAGHRLPGCCWPPAEASAWSWWWSPASRPHVDGCARVLAPAAPLRLPRCRPGPAAPVLDRSAVPDLARRRPSSEWTAAGWCASRRRPAGVAGRLPGWQCVRHPAAA